MKKFCLFTMVLIFALLIRTNFIQAKDFDTKSCGTTKIWAIHFNGAVDPNTIQGNVYVKDSNGKVIDTKLSTSDDKTVVYIIPINPYTVGQTYIITADTNVKSSKEENLKENITMKFNVDNELTVTIE